MTPYENPSPFKDALGWAPIALALAALILVLSYVALFGIPRETDEGTAAHVWQLLMAAQVPLVVIFALKWLPKRPRAALAFIGLQAAAALAAMAPVALLGL
ncbi:MAG TPA: hypothetical protein VLL50_03490 [Usitatibacter sp.]|nr:hypothetical protein [Usitatibacter sp.]